MKKLTYNYVKSFIESEGYTLLSDSYVNNSTKLRVRCPKGHEYEVSFANFKQGNRCPVCQGMKKYTYKEVKNYIESQGYTLLSTTYNKRDDKLLVKCDKGHEYEVSFANFKQGCRCPVCQGMKKYTYKEVKNYIESQGYTLLDKEYKNVKTKLLIKCPEGHEYKVRFSHFKEGCRCPICNGSEKLTYDHVKNYFESKGYTLLDKEYKNVKTKLLIKCPEGHEYKVSFNSFKQGSRCPICWAGKQSSKGEEELANFIKSLGIDVIENDRTQIINPLTKRSLELDVWIPSLNKAIEFNGTYWHSLDNVIIRDDIKVNKCKEKGIDLLIIEEQKWKDDKKLEQQKIKEWILN